MKRRNFVSHLPALLAVPLCQAPWGQGTRDAAGRTATVEAKPPAFRTLLWEKEEVTSRPCFSPSGDRVLYMRAPASEPSGGIRNSDSNLWSLWSIPREGGPATAFFSHGEVRATRPDSCPATGMIAFTGIRNNRAELWLINEDGSGLTHLPVGDPVLSRIFYPSWYPDGSRLAVTDYEHHQVVSVSVSSGEVTPLTDPGMVWAGMSSVTQKPGGDPILAFAGQRPGAFYNASANTIWLKAAGDSPILLDGKHGRTPAWSPDGGRLAFSSVRGRPAPAAIMRPRSLPAGKSSVFLTSVDPRRAERKEAIPLSPIDHTAIHPKWSPDGTEIVCSVTELESGRSGIGIIKI